MQCLSAHRLAYVDLSGTSDFDVAEHEMAKSLPCPTENGPAMAIFGQVDASACRPDRTQRAASAYIARVNLTLKKQWGIAFTQLSRHSWQDIGAGRDSSACRRNRVRSGRDLSCRLVGGTPSDFIVTIMKWASLNVLSQ